MNNEVFIYLCLAVISISILYVSSIVENIRVSSSSEYYYSKSLRASYSTVVASLFFFTSFITSFLHKLNSWIVGMSMISGFLLATFYEMLVFKNSHNLLPAELVIYFFYSLPSITGAYFGAYLKCINQK